MFPVDRRMSTVNETATIVRTLSERSIRFFDNGIYARATGRDTSMRYIQDLITIYHTVNMDIEVTGGSCQL